MRKRNRKTIIVENTFDYDKLAEAIVKANKGNELPCSEAQEKEKLTLSFVFKLFWNIILNKNQSNGTTTSGLFGLLTSFVFNALAFISLLVLILGSISAGIIFFNFTWSLESFFGNVTAILITVVAFIVIALFVLMFRAAANEIDKEKDRNYIVAVFSAIVSFAALIVASVALLKGVG